MRIAAYFAAAFCLSGCPMPLHYSTETAWPGSAVGKVEARTESPSGPAILGPDGKPLVAPVFIKGAPVPLQLPVGETVRTPRHFHYQIRDRDGTLHILQSEA